MNKVDKKPSLISLIIVILVGMLMLCFGIYGATAPLRSGWAKGFVARGDNFLNQKKYLSAIVEYKKADLLLPNSEVKQKIALARSAGKDVFLMENFYRQNNNIIQMELINQVRSVPDSSYDMVTLSRALIEQNEPQLAVEAAETATEMNKEYRDAWLYLGISNLAVIKQTELAGNAYQIYYDNAKLALEQAKRLDPSYATTSDLLKQL